MPKPKKKWVDLGTVKDLKKKRLREVKVGKQYIALTFRKGKFSAVSGECNHANGPLGRGKIRGDYIICPWHAWTFHRKTGHGHPPFEAACLPRYGLKEKKGRLFINPKPLNKRQHAEHTEHPLAKKIKRPKGGIRVVGISASPMDTGSMGRYSTSEDLLDLALKHASRKFKAKTKMIRLRDLNFNHCGGFYSINERACVWPCAYTQFDPEDEMDKIYEALLIWADVILIATPIRWGSASSLYYKMVERLNCVENRKIVEGDVLVKNKVMAFIVTGGQDNVQSVAGQMLTVFGQFGFNFPEFPFVGHSRGWWAEDMENNTEYVKNSKKLREDVKKLADRAVNHAKIIVKTKKKGVK